MPTHRTLLIVVADGEHARFVRPSGDNALHTVSHLDSDTAHQRSSDLRSDHPGASFHTGASAHHAITPRHDPHEMEKEKFAKLVAERLNAAAERSEFDDLVLIAPPHTLTAIREGLDSDTTDRMIGMLERDLVKTPDHELWSHVKSWVPPVHRTVL
ncbi:MAG: hypothetical protein B7Z80_00870 [Rhodospirillales bacterium 20-64-7]|nr:MAG: hypothetical protein B7Z80_00870 [Rhodospirillales bacterium 20-64-7]HQT75737.1 host attachment protein [Rhodopila sp.]